MPSLNQLGSHPASSSLFGWRESNYDSDWAPFKAADQTNTDQIATDIADESWSYFQQIPFMEWVLKTIESSRGAPRFPRDALGRFHFHHDQLSFRLYAYLWRHPDEMVKYQRVEKVVCFLCNPVCLIYSRLAKALRERNPFAHSAVLNSLRLHQPTSVRRYSQPILEMDFIIEPLQELLRSQHRPL